MRILLVILALQGCTPFIEGGVGYSERSGVFESGAVGHVAAGVEFRENAFVDECGLYHRSMIDRKPERENNDFLCKKRWRFGE